VVADKLIGRRKPIAADFVALTVPDRFLFGYGMDVAAPGATCRQSTPCGRIEMLASSAAAA
jgi:hypoxanthine-guanine phosphoribosyltransferase